MNQSPNLLGITIEGGSIPTSIGSRLILMIRNFQWTKLTRAQGQYGLWFRNGGDLQLYESLPLVSEDLVIDAGGYKGEWTIQILARYGCRSDIFEPIPKFIDEARKILGKNARVNLHQAAIGADSGTVKISIADVGSSIFLQSTNDNSLEVKVIGINEYLLKATDSRLMTSGRGGVGCLMLNIEGSEYEVLEKLLATGDIDRFRCLLIQFHPQPDGYQQRYLHITKTLLATHKRVYYYPMMWERWDLKPL